MAKFNERKVVRDDATYVFITRGRSKPFTDDEVTEYFTEPKKSMQHGGSAPKSTFRVEGDLIRIFTRDLEFGATHCAKKYGVSEDAIWLEARRLFPTQNLDKIVGRFERRV